MFNVGRVLVLNSTPAPTAAAAPARFDIGHTAVTIAVHMVHAEHLRGRGAGSMLGVVAPCWSSCWVK